MIDILLLLPLAFGAYRGYSKGLLLEIVGIIAFILAIVVGIKFLHIGMEFLVNQFDQVYSFFPYLAFILLFIGTILAVSLLGKLLKTVLDMTLLGSVDNIAGAIVGLLKWAFGISLVLWFMQTIGVDMPEDVVNNSYIYPYLVLVAPASIDFLATLVPYADGLMDMMNKLVQTQGS